jgi:hypothetical protein
MTRDEGVKKIEAFGRHPLSSRVSEEFLRPLGDNAPFRPRDGKTLCLSLGRMIHIAKRHMRLLVARLVAKGPLQLRLGASLVFRSASCPEMSKL